MRRVLLLAILSLGLVLTACADEQPGETGTDEAGTVRGTVLLGPTCPVEPVTDETETDPCSDRPLGDVRIRVFGPAGDVVATARSDADGAFTLRLAPGEYTVEAAIEDDPVRSTSPIDVTVAEGQQVEITVPVDSGIRMPDVG